MIDQSMDGLRTEIGLEDKLTDEIRWDNLDDITIASGWELSNDWFDLIDLIWEIEERLLLYDVMNERRRREMREVEKWEEIKKKVREDEWE